MRGPGPQACHVQVQRAGETVAEAMADAFRPDLLRSGQGHGHHGFDARLHRPLPPGPGTVVLHLPQLGLNAPMQLLVPELDPPRPQLVEDMLRQPPGWTTADVAAHPACLQLDANAGRLGPERFTDAVFRFAFARWPTAAEARFHVASLRAGRITPQHLVLECLASRERAELPPGLPGPFDAEFPFMLS